jgi:dTDP-4-dehydrorhamnose reductase
MKKILITGDGGQLAWELRQTQPAHLECYFWGVDQLDITDEQQVITQVTELQPDLIINAAAYTAVDKAESDRDTAYAVNDLGSQYLAQACRNVGAKLVHISTDFVFDGRQTTPYFGNETPNPINVYGASKLAGEQKVQAILAGNAVIIRTAWVYSCHGNNFVKTMLRLMKEKEQLGVVYDQVGTPTWAKGLAEMIWALIDKGQDKSDKIKDSNPWTFNQEPCNETPIINWTDAGVCSWYDFAISIQELAFAKGMLDKEIAISAIPASAYPTPAKRPSFSVIDKSNAEKYSGIATRHWRKQLNAMLTQLQQGDLN